MRQGDKMPQLPADKANHAIYGALIFLLALAITRRMDVSYGLVVLAAVGKEVLDWLSNQRSERPTHGVEWLDALATCAGGAVPLLARVI
jgi:hypothetical protein